MTLDCLKYFIFIRFVNPNTSVKYLLFCHLVDEKSQRSERISNPPKMTALGMQTLGLETRACAHNYYIVCYLLFYL